MSYRFEVLVEGKWYPNKVYFATQEEAQKAADVKFYSWTLCQDRRVIEDTEPVNYRFDEATGYPIHIATTD